MPHTISHVVVGAVYHPPARDGSVMLTHIFDCLDTVTHDHPYARVVLVGDFNKTRDAMLMSYPLKQVVRSSTRGSAILDKISTNISDWYECPVILPNIGRSVGSPCSRDGAYAQDGRVGKGRDVTLVVHSQDPSGRALLAQAIFNTDWTPLYCMKTCDDELLLQYTVKSNDYYLPLLTVKPWVADQFQRLIRCWQNAWKNGQTARYKSYRNRVNRMSKTLQSKYYARKIKGLRVSNPRNWWHNMKMITGQKTSTCQPLRGLANLHNDVMTVI